VGNPGNAPDTRYEPNGVGGVDYAYSIGKFEITAGQYAEFLNAVADTDLYWLYDTRMWSEYGCLIERTGSPNSYAYSAVPTLEDIPVNFVSWASAARFCNWLENGQPTGAQDLTTTEDGSYYLNGALSDYDLFAATRKEGARWVIPTADEWYKAAYHKNDGVTGNYFDYPTSSDSTPSNDWINPDPGNNATFADDDYTVDWPHQTPVGAHENSESPYGTFDQGGNVFEWNETTFYDQARMYRGGAWSSPHGHMLSSYCRYSDHNTDAWDHTGFRVAYIPEPATLALLAFGGLALLRRRRTDKPHNPMSRSA